MAESARGLADCVDRPQGGGRRAVVRRSPATPGTTPPSSPSCAPGPGRGRVHGLPLPRAAVDPPALLRRPAPGLRRRDHDHRLAQPAVGQRLQVLRRDGRPGDPARRRRDHRLRQGGLRPRDPREAVRGRPGRRLDRPGRGPRSTRPTSPPSSASRSAPRATSRSSTRRCTASARPRSPRPCLRAGFDRLDILASQRTPDGDFPNVPGHVSNPEIPKTLDAAIDRGPGDGADLVLASDPDADRIGVAVPVTGDPKGEWTTLDGNQIGVLLAAFVMEKTREAGKLRPDHYLVTTLVTSQMARALAEREGVGMRGRPARRLQVDRPADRRGRARGFLFGFEESHGYLKGTYVRDKDAAVAALLFAELAADRQGAEADGPGVPRRPLHRRRPLRRAADQQDVRGPRGGRADQDADGRLPRESPPSSRRPGRDRGPRLQDARDPRRRHRRARAAPAPSPRATC